MNLHDKLAELREALAELREALAELREALPAPRDCAASELAYKQQTMKENDDENG